MAQKKRKPRKAPPERSSPEQIISGLKASAKMMAALGCATPHERKQRRSPRKLRTKK